MSSSKYKFSRTFYLKTYLKNQNKLKNPFSKYTRPKNYNLSKKPRIKRAKFQKTLNVRVVNFSAIWEMNTKNNRKSGRTKFKSKRRYLPTQNLSPRIYKNYKRWDSKSKILKRYTKTSILWKKARNSSRSKSKMKRF